MTANHAHTPNISDFREDFVTACAQSYWLSADRARDYFNRELAAIEAAAEQRGALKALRDAAESHDVIDHMYKHFDNHPIQAPAAVRATATYLHNRADRLEGDDETH